jgi:hypothetical protein
MVMSFMKNSKPNMPERINRILFLNPGHKKALAVIVFFLAFVGSFM